MSWIVLSVSGGEIVMVGGAVAAVVVAEDQEFDILVIVLVS